MFRIEQFETLRRSYDDATKAGSICFALRHAHSSILKVGPFLTVDEHREGLQKPTTSWNCPTLSSIYPNPGMGDTFRLSGH